MVLSNADPVAIQNAESDGQPELGRDTVSRFPRHSLLSCISPSPHNNNISIRILGPLFFAVRQGHAKPPVDSPAKVKGAYGTAHPWVFVDTGCLKLCCQCKVS